MMKNAFTNFFCFWFNPSLCKIFAKVPTLRIFANKLGKAIDEGTGGRGEKKNIRL